MKQFEAAQHSLAFLNDYFIFSFYGVGESLNLQGQDDLSNLCFRSSETLSDGKN